MAGSSSRPSDRPYTLADLAALCDQFVPKYARHDRSFDRGEYSWWPAHELGHLLVSTRAQRRQRMFGIDVDEIISSPDEINAARCYEIAAMTISGKLLCAAGAPALAEDERESTDYDTMTWGYDNTRAVHRLLVARGANRIPKTYRRLVRLLERKA